MKNNQMCVLCKNFGTEIFGYVLCETCKRDLGLFTDETIKKHISLYNNSEKKRSYEEEIQYRLSYIEKDYIKKKIKLLHILERLKSFK